MELKPQLYKFEYKTGKSYVDDKNILCKFDKDKNNDVKIVGFKYSSSNIYNITFQKIKWYDMPNLRKKKWTKTAITFNDLTQEEKHYYIEMKENNFVSIINIGKKNVILDAHIQYNVNEELLRKWDGYLFYKFYKVNKLEGLNELVALNTNKKFKEELFNIIFK